MSSLLGAKMSMACRYRSVILPPMLTSFAKAADRRNGSLPLGRNTLTASARLPHQKILDLPDKAWINLPANEAEIPEATETAVAPLPWTQPA